MDNDKVRILKIEGLLLRQKIFKLDAEGEADRVEKSLLYNKAREFGDRADQMAYEMTMRGRTLRPWKSFRFFLKWLVFAFMVGAMLAAGQSTADRVWPRPPVQWDLNLPESE